MTICEKSGVVEINRKTTSLDRIAIFSPLATFFFFTLAALILTYPLVFHLFSHIPRGSEEVGTVPFFNLWTLQWNVDQLGRGYPNYWDAPIFAPYRGVFAFSESQLVSGLLVAPLWLALRSATLAYNALVLLFLILNGWFAYWLLRNWGATRLPALLTGFIIQALPFVAQEMGVLQLIALFGFLWSLLFLHRFLAHNDRSTWRVKLGLILGPPVTFFTCSYYGLFSLFFLPLAFLTHLRRNHLTTRVIGQLLVITLLITALSGPFLLSQRQQLASYDFSRSDKTITNNSAKLTYYANFLDYNLLYGQILGIESDQGQRLFPGLGLILLAIVGLVGLNNLRAKVYLTVAILLALALSTGLRFNLDGWQPYQWVREYVPGFAQLRSPFRFAAFVQLHLALLAGFGLCNLGRWLPHRRKSVLSGVAILILVESLALPLPLQAIPPLQGTVAWQTWLNQHQQPARIVLLPFAQTNGVAAFEQTTYWMLATRLLQGDMLNGYSGFFPRDHSYLRQQMLQFPTDEAIRLLREKGVDYIVVYQGLPNAPPGEAVEVSLKLVYQDTMAQVVIYALDAGP